MENLKMSNVHVLEKFNFHLYIISSSEKGPVKIGYSNNPPSRLKEMQTANHEKLHIWGSISVKELKIVQLIEKLIHFYLKINKTHLRGEFFQITPELALQIFESFPVARKNLFEKVNITKNSMDNVMDIHHLGLKNNIITEDDYDLLQETFDWGDEDNNYKFINLTS